MWSTTCMASSCHTMWKVLVPQYHGLVICLAMPDIHHPNLVGLIAEDPVQDPEAGLHGLCVG